MSSDQVFFFPLGFSDHFFLPFHKLLSEQNFQGTYRIGVRRELATASGSLVSLSPPACSLHLHVSRTVSRVKRVRQSGLRFVANGTLPCDAAKDVC